MNTTAPYPVGALIVYGGSGVCRVIGVGVPEGQSKTYYTRAPLYGTEVIYAPVDTRVFLRPVLTKEEADDLIRSMPSIRAERVETGNLQLRSRQYQASFQSHDAADLVKLIKTIHWRDAAARESGKRPGKLEEKYRKRAEELLYGELSAALGISRETVPQYIRGMLKEGKSGAGKAEAAS